jgi:hypothetical protein
MVPILAMNRAKSLWGEDALEFKYVVPATRLFDYLTIASQTGTVGIRP